MRNVTTVPVTARRPHLPARTSGAWRRRAGSIRRRLQVRCPYRQCEGAARKGPDVHRHHRPRPAHIERRACGLRHRQQERTPGRHPTCRHRERLWPAAGLHRKAAAQSRGQAPLRLGGRQGARGNEQSPSMAGLRPTTLVRGRLQQKQAGQCYRKTAV